MLVPAFNYIWRLTTRFLKILYGTSHSGIAYRQRDHVTIFVIL